MNGGDDDDRIYGHEGNDNIYGGWGKDELWGGAGRDTMVGGPNPFIDPFVPFSGTGVPQDNDVIVALRADNDEVAAHDDRIIWLDLDPAATNPIGGLGEILRGETIGRVAPACEASGWWSMNFDDLLPRDLPPSDLRVD